MRLQQTPYHARLEESGKEKGTTKKTVVAVGRIGQAIKKAEEEKEAQSKRASDAAKGNLHQLGTDHGPNVATHILSDNESIHSSNFWTFGFSFEVSSFMSNLLFQIALKNAVC